jgi:hypothetical protein
VKDRHIHALTLLLVAAGLGFITFIYVSQPKTIAEVATKGSVAIGTYDVDQTELSRGLELFRRDSFPAARSAFDRADPEKRDPAVQFYIAYSFYREGWGRFSNDDALFAVALTAANRVDSLKPNFSATDPALAMKTTAELKTELEEGLKITSGDFNPLKLARERK